jgi:hypothetical protein
MEIIEMAEKTKIFEVDGTKVNVEDLPREIRVLVDFFDRLAQDMEDSNEELNNIQEEFSYKLSMLNMARNHTYLQLQQQIMEYLQKQVTSKNEEEEPEPSSSKDKGGKKNA